MCIRDRFAIVSATEKTKLISAWQFSPSGVQTAITIISEQDIDSFTFEEKDNLFATIKKIINENLISCILIDEAQFLTPKQVWELSDVADKLNIPVMCFGLRTDFQGKLFPGSETLLSIADNLREIRTICECGKKAIMVVRQDENGNVIKEGQQIEIGGNDKYISLCRYHWKSQMNKL